jgi:hypothetical protein
MGEQLLNTDCSDSGLSIGRRGLASCRSLGFGLLSCFGKRLVRGQSQRRDTIEPPTYLGNSFQIVLLKRLQMLGSRLQDRRRRFSLVCWNELKVGKLGQLVGNLLLVAGDTAGLTGLSIQFA